MLIRCLSSVRAVERTCARCVSPFLAASCASRLQSTDNVEAPYIITENVSGDGHGKKAVRRGWFVMKGIRGHTKKLNPVARQIVGKSVPEALAQMAFSDQKRSKNVRTAIERAVLNADFYHDLTPNQLLVERAWTGKQLTSVRVRHHSKGRAGMSHWRTSMFSVRLREMTTEESKHLLKFPYRPSAQSKAALDPHGY